MKLLFCLLKYFPYGGLQRDFISIAETCLKRGHSIHVLTTAWDGERPHEYNVSIVAAKGLTNHGRMRNFARQVLAHTRREYFDVVVGFNKIPGLDLYYAADPCYKAGIMEEKGFLYRMGGRCRTYEALEKAVFGSSSNTHILLISEREREKFIRYYQTPEERFHSLPPGIAKDRRLSDSSAEIRRQVRHEFEIKDDDFFLLMIGSSFGTKGLDRSILAIAALPEGLKKKAKLVVVGRGDAQPFKKLALQKKVDDRLFFLGGRDDVPRFLSGADLLLHPAYSENTGTVLLEAMLSGLPVLATENCGYAYHVREAEAGLLVPLPFKQSSYNTLLKHMMTSPERETWKRNAFRYSSQKDFFGMPEKAADIIESVTKRGGIR